jgi:ABC-2 type transport system permease protein
MAAIFKKELRTYFTTLTGYAFLGFFVLITGYYFVSRNIEGGSLDYRGTLYSTMIIFLLLIPIITMRLFAEESRQKTDQLLYTSPVRVTDIVLGKFFAAGFLLLIGIAITMVFPFILSRLGDLTFKEVIGVVIGYYLLGLCFISIGVFISVLTDNQLVAAAATFITEVFFLVMIDSIAANAPAGRIPSLIFIAAIILVVLLVLQSGTKNIIMTLATAVISYGILAVLYFKVPSIFDNTITNVCSWLSVLNRFQNFCVGVFSVSDVVYYVTFSAAFVYLTVSVIEKRRWS